MKAFKYVCIVMVAAITGKTIINLFGGTYIVAGMAVKRIR